MDRAVQVAGALVGALGVALGAFGAHALRARLEPQALAVYQTAVQYQLVHALALLAAAQIGRQAPGGLWAGAFFLAGVVLFCGSLYALVAGAPKAVGMLTPVGGLFFIGGWLLLAWARSSPQG